jgi:hypothetical protein
MCLSFPIYLNSCICFIRDWHTLRGRLDLELLMTPRHSDHYLGSAHDKAGIRVLLTFFEISTPLFIIIFPILYADYS